MSALLVVEHETLLTVLDKDAHVQCIECIRSMRVVIRRARRATAGPRVRARTAQVQRHAARAEAPGRLCVEMQLAASPGLRSPSLRTANVRAVFSATVDDDQRNPDAVEEPRATQ